jgi:hypothetical protein
MKWKSTARITTTSKWNNENHIVRFEFFIVVIVVNYFWFCWLILKLRTIKHKFIVHFHFTKRDKRNKQFKREKDKMVVWLPWQQSLVLCSRTVCLSNKGLGLQMVSSVITILVIGRCGAHRRKPRTTFCSTSSFFIGIVIFNYRYLFQTSWFRWKAEGAPRRQRRYQQVTPWHQTTAVATNMCCKYWICLIRENQF